MRVALYQINSDRDTFNTKFMSWRWRTDHDYIILPEEYDKVFDGDIQARSLAEIFVLFNVMPPEGFVGHSASVSDVIAIYDENDNPSYHFVDSAGFVDVDFGMRYAVDALQKQDSPISIREYMAMANIENEKWFDVADTVTLNSITIGKIETKEVPSQYSSLYALYHFSDLLSRKIQFLGTSCKDNFVIGNLSGYVRENELLFRSYALSHWSITPDTDTSSFVNQMVRELKGNLSGNLPEEEYEDLCMVIEATKGVEDTHIAKVKYEDCTISYTFQDVLARGLSYAGGTNSVTLEFFTDEACTNKVTTWKQSDGKFKVTREENNDGTHTMTISMTDDGLAEINTANTAYDNDNGKLYAGYSNYTLRIRYDAKLNSDESLVYGDNGNKNEVVLTWKRTNDTYYDTLIDDAHIYTYATNITKTFSDGKEEQTMFDNVLFKAQNASDGYYVIAQLNEDEGIWYVTGHTDKEASATAMHPVEWNGKKGQIILKGVEDDQYIWTELETANGYTLLKNNIDVTITSVDDANRPCDIYSKDTLGVIQNDPRYKFDGGLNLKLANIPQTQLAHNYQTASATVDGNDVTMLDDEMDTDSTNAIAPLQVVNTKGFETPMTGENGTWALAIGGVLVFCLGTSAFIFFLVFKKRKEQEDK